MADVTLDFKYDQPVEKVWEALTDSNILSKWIMDNNFNPEKGKEFNFTSEPNEWWDGKIKGKVTDLEVNKKLGYDWNSAGENTKIIWNLEDNGNGTDLHFEMSGFSDETKNRPGALEGAKHSWNEFGNKLKEVLDSQK